MKREKQTRLSDEMIKEVMREYKIANAEVSKQVPGIWYNEVRNEVGTVYIEETPSDKTTITFLLNANYTSQIDVVQSGVSNDIANALISRIPDIGIKAVQYGSVGRTLGPGQYTASWVYILLLDTAGVLHQVTAASYTVYTGSAGVQDYDAASDVDNFEALDLPAPNALNHSGNRDLAKGLTRQVIDKQGELFTIQPKAGL